MRILFLTYHGFEEASGISKKMLAQIKGLRQNGHEVHVCYYDLADDGSRCRYVDGEVICNYGRLSATMVKAVGQHFCSVWTIAVSTTIAERIR